MVDFESMKIVAREILTTTEMGYALVVGSMALALYEEKYLGTITHMPQDIDIVIITDKELGATPYDKSILEPIRGLTSSAGTEFKYIGNEYTGKPEITVDVIRPRKVGIDVEKAFEDSSVFIEDIACQKLKILEKAYENVEDESIDPGKIDASKIKLDVINSIKETEQWKQEEEQEQERIKLKEEEEEPQQSKRLKLELSKRLFGGLKRKSRKRTRKSKRKRKGKRTRKSKRKSKRKGNRKSSRR